MTNERNVTTDDAYTDQVRKLIPAEVSAAFLAINSIIDFNDDYWRWILGFFIALIPVCWLYLARFQGVTSKLQLAFTSLIAFPIWSSSIAIDRIDYLADKRFLPACFLIIVTLVAPFVVRGSSTDG